MNDRGKPNDPLHTALMEWRSEAPLPPRFQEKVWQRIEQQASARPTLWILAGHWLSNVLPRPALAAAYLIILVALGGTAGWAQAVQQNLRVKNELGERYVLSLDPLLSSGTRTHQHP